MTDNGICHDECRLYSKLKIFQEHKTNLDLDAQNKVMPSSESRQDKPFNEKKI